MNRDTISQQMEMLVKERSDLFEQLQTVNDKRCDRAIFLKQEISGITGQLVALSWVLERL